jgi:hypothetical protein
MDIVSAQNIVDCIESTTLIDLKDNLYKTAIRYAGIRAKWYVSILGERKEADFDRTSAHNAFIDACNILSRNMAKISEDNCWRAALGDDRKTIGDFACYLHCILGLRAR